MPTHDYIIANGTGAAVRADINLALSAIVSLNSSASEPGTMYAYQLWADTAAGLLKIRNGANSAWVTLRQLDGDFSIVAVEDGLQATPSLTFTNDLNTGVFRSGADALAIVTGGQYAIACTSTQAVGIRTPNPSTALHVAGNARVGADDVTDAHLQIGKGATGNRNSYIDIVGDTTYTDYGLRVIRNNTGANATSELKHRGTGALNITTQEAAPIVFNTTNSPQVTIDASGRLLIGSSSSYAGKFQSWGAVTANAGTPNVTAIDTTSVAQGVGGELAFIGQFQSGDYAYFGSIRGIKENATSGDTACALTFFTRPTAAAPVEAARIDSSGRLLVGAASNSGGSVVQIQGPSSTAAASIGSLTLRSAYTPISNFSTDLICKIDFQLADGGVCAKIECYTDGATVGTNDYPGALVFSTTADGAPSPTERMRISANGNVNVVGALSKGSGSFRIDHPLSEKKDTHHLIHSFIEGPQADLIYRGHVNLINGKAIINIDEAARMAEGTFNALCTNVCCFTSNESDWTAVRGSVSDNILTIEAQDLTSTAEVCWMVIGERKDQHMLDTNWTDENGRVITEPLKEVTPSVTL